jgi:nitrate reductase assembly molybdenum cofactor insertion protein NarJ
MKEASNMDTTDVITINAAPAERRPALAFLMASLLTGYPDNQFAHCVSTVLADEQLDPASTVAGLKVWRTVRRNVNAVIASEAALNRLRSTYIDLFDHGRQHNSLYETEYGRERPLGKGTELADIAGFYRAFGLEFGDEAHEMLDHIAVELEFYALLLMKQEALVANGDEEGQAIVLDARQKFLTAHVGRFVGALAQRPGVIADEWYGPLLAWCRDLVAEECQRVGVTPIPVDWLDTQAEQEQMSCGGTCSLLGRNRSADPA